MTKPDHLTPPEVGRLARVSRQAVVMAIVLGRLDASRVGPNWIVPRAAAEAFAAAHEKKRKDRVDRAAKQLARAKAAAKRK